MLYLEDHFVWAVKKKETQPKTSNQWPSLSETVNNGSGKNNVELGNKSSDTVMADKFYSK